MELQKIKELIEEKYPGAYSDTGIKSVLEGIENLSAALREDLEKLLTTGKISDREVEGYSVKKLMEETGMNELAAFLTLGWLEREPEEAKASLRKGHDEVRFNKKV